MKYTMNFDVSNETSNIMHMLDPIMQEEFLTFTPSIIETCFGPGIEDCFDQSKGYTDPEWYWVSSKRQVWGIGWRYGKARLRGRMCGRNGPALKKEDAEEFLRFLSSKTNQY